MHHLANLNFRHTKVLAVKYAEDSVSTCRQFIQLYSLYIYHFLSRTPTPSIVSQTAALHDFIAMAYELKTVCSLISYCKMVR